MGPPAYSRLKPVLQGGLVSGTGFSREGVIFYTAKWTLPMDLQEPACCGPRSDEPGLAATAAASDPMHSPASRLLRCICVHSARPGFIQKRLSPVRRLPHRKIDAAGCSRWTCRNRLAAGRGRTNPVWWPLLQRLTQCIRQQAGSYGEIACISRTGIHPEPASAGKSSFENRPPKKTGA